MGNNPFADASFNLTEAGQIIAEDPARAKVLAKAAGKNPANFGL